jgi:CheY-like chemotaxis protein/biotin operon repressor
MQCRALVVEDNEDIAERVTEILDSLGHQHLWVRSQEEARQPIREGGFQYVLLDLSIPVRAQCGLDSIEYGANLAKEIHRSAAMRGVPIIVMTAYGKEGLEFAAPLCDHGVVDFINKPFPTTGRTLASVIESVLARTYSKREQVTPCLKPEKPFDGGELTFYEDRIELCGVTVASEARSRQIWIILNTLNQKLANGRYRAFSGKELAAKVGKNVGQGSIAGSIRDYRHAAAETLHDELGLKVDLEDIVESNRGYRYKAWITVKDMRLPPAILAGAQAAAGERATGGADDDVSARREQVLQLVRDGERLRVPDLAARLGCSPKTAARVVDQLKSEGLIAFVGPARTGRYQMSPASTSGGSD